MDFAILTGVAAAQGYGLDSPILLIESDGGRYGLLIEQIIGIEQMDEQQLQLGDQLSESDSVYLATMDSDHGQGVTKRCLVHSLSFKRSTARNSSLAHWKQKKGGEIDTKDSLTRKLTLIRFGS